MPSRLRSLRAIATAAFVVAAAGTAAAFGTDGRSLFAFTRVPSRAGPTALRAYEPKWKKKETLAETLGVDSTDAEDVGLDYGTIPIVFKQGNSTLRTSAAPGQPLSYVAAQAGQPIRYGCKKGECGTCECMMSGKWVRPCIEPVPDTVKPGEELIIVLKELRSKTTSSGKFYSVKSFFMGFYNNFVGMFGFVKQRRAAKRNWMERIEYEDSIKARALELRVARLEKEATAATAATLRAKEAEETHDGGIEDLMGIISRQLAGEEGKEAYGQKDKVGLS